MSLTLTYPDGGVLIVGGTGRVGEGIVRVMGRAGVPVLFTYRGGNGRGGAEKATTLEAELRQAGYDVTARQMTMAEPASIQAAFEAVIARHGRLHAVMCAAGPVVPFRRIVDFTPDEVEAFYHGDMFDYFRLYRAAVHMMRGKGGGTIIGTSTMANRRALEFDGISATSKAAIDSLTRQIAIEEAAHGIRCNSVQIGWVVPQTLDEVRGLLPPRPAGPPATAEEMQAELLRKLIERTRLPRAARLEEAGYLFAYLASNEASYITGQAITFDGGTTV